MGNTNCCGGEAREQEALTEIQQPKAYANGGYANGAGDDGYATAKAAGNGNGNGFAPPNPQMFEITLKKGPKDRIGIDVDHKDAKRLLVEEIHSSGLVRSFNNGVKAAAGKEFQAGEYVKPGDYIVSVNGVLNSVDMIRECQAASSLRMQIVRY